MNQVTPHFEKTNLPPGPRGKWRPTLKLIRNPRQAMEEWVSQFGDPFLLNALNGPVVVTGREDLIREIHGQDPNVYETFATQTTGPIIGTGSMLILFGERHRRERRMMTPIFHGDRMKAYGSSMQTIALQRMEQHARQEKISTVDLMTEISLEVIIRAIFGGTDRELAEKMFTASKKLMARANALLFFSRKSHFSCLGFTPWDRWRAARLELAKLLDAAIDQRRAEPVPREDILALLCLAQYEDGQLMSREDIHSELLTFLFAGHETTALSMAWAIYHLHRQSQQAEGSRLRTEVEGQSENRGASGNAIEKLRAEIDSLPDDAPDRFAAAPYLKAVIQETLRIHPIITETLRKLRVPLRLGDYQLPAGMAIAPATVLAHYNPEVYPQPDEFRPERFLERSFSPFQYMPFGGGHRRCIGAAFASYEMAVVLGSLLKHYEFALLERSEVVPKRRSVTMGPSTNILVRVKKRKSRL
jgi:cytochrome P450 family 110